MKIFSSKSEKRRYYRRLRVKFYCFVGLILAAAIGLAYGVLNLQMLKIKTFTVAGATKLEELRPLVFQSKTARILGLDNFWSWPGRVGNAIIRKNYSAATLEIIGPAAERFAIWCTSASSAQAPCYWVNHDGIAIEEAPDTEGSSIAKIEDNRPITPITNKEVLSNGQFAAVAKILEEVPGLPIVIVKYKYDNRLEQLSLIGSHGENLIFSVRFVPSEKTLASLAELIISGKARTAEYVDFTVENRIYLKPN